jgi:hypothetical protein
LGGEISALQRELSLKVQKDQATHKEVSDRITDLERKVTEAITRLDADLSKLRSGPSTQISGYTPGSGQPPRPMGRIQLQNNSLGPVTITINGKAYTLPARQSRLLENQPAGPFTYEVQAEGYGTIRPPSPRDLAANDTYTIEVFPR